MSTDEENDRNLAPDADDLDDEGRRRLHAALDRGLAEVRDGKGIPIDEALRNLGIRARE